MTTNNKHTCKLCNITFHMVGIATHLKDTHKISVIDYINQYGEYRPKQLIKLERLKHSNYKCIICNELVVSDRALSNHVRLKHGIHKTEYVKHYIFNDEKQLCKCGCGNEVALLTISPYRVNYISGHNPNGMIGRKHSEQSKRKMSKSAIKRITLSKGISHNTKPELEFKHFLDYNNIKYTQQYVIGEGIIDFYLHTQNLLIEIDGNYWHPIAKKNLNFQQFKNLLNEIKKKDIPNLLRIQDSNIKKINTINDIYIQQTKYDYNIKETQVLLTCEYLTKYFSNNTHKQNQKKKNYLVDYICKYIVSITRRESYKIIDMLILQKLDFTHYNIKQLAK